MKKVALILILTLVSPAFAGQVNIPNAFVAGTKAKAGEVNANFTAVKTAVDDNDARVATLEANLATTQAQLADAINRITDLETTLAALQDDVSTNTDDVASLETNLGATQTNVATNASDISGLDTRVAALEASPEVALAPYVSVEQDEIGGLSGPHIIFTGANVHIRSGGPFPVTPYDVNGVGNLILGYNGLPDDLVMDYGRTGSHNLVIGNGHEYTSAYAIVAGKDNISNSWAASILGGYWNLGEGHFSAIVGGRGNNTGQPTGGGTCAVVVAGEGNTATGMSAVVVGGDGNGATATRAVAVGGEFNYAHLEDQIVP